ncbi:uncharacterized protein [Heptranchias perlo]|uniref:uncharacterized protein n=1 Tax=Heptranchias perlo TaxID=212740 RepID=UPI00355A4C99
MDLLGVSNVKFAIDLFKQLNKDDETGNIFVSPLSISAALAMVYLGAKGSTAAQMAKVLAFTEGQDVHSEFQILQAAINKPDTSYLLKLANRLYGEKTYNFLSDFLGSTLKYYQAELATVDFVNAADETRQQINSWTEAQTEGKIKNLLAEGTLDDLTKLVLVNAIYFKGNWDKKFKEEFTYDGQFRINQNETKPVQMMRLKAKFNNVYIHDVETRILELPYVQSELSMIILLPDMKDDSNELEKLQSQLAFDKLMDWTNPEMMDNVEVNVVLPKFKLEEQYDLKSTLTHMGMVDAFSDLQANFSGMTGKNDLVLSKVVHKSFVEVNEEGTEAAAATAPIFKLRCAMRTVDFVADHPFLFFIRHNKSRNILFFGRLSSPLEEEDKILKVKGNPRLSQEENGFNISGQNGNGENNGFAPSGRKKGWILNDKADKHRRLHPGLCVQLKRKFKTMENLSKANCHFTLDLFRKLSETNQAGNIFFSPFSISNALAMVYLGSKNNTASQMAKALHFDQVGDLHSGFQKMQLDINRAGVSYLLKVANRLYGEKTYNFLEEFCNSSMKFYGADLSAVDFLTAADETRQEINKWVEAQTEGKIQDLLAQGSVHSLTRLVLVNAIYFKGSWAEKFDEHFTEEMPFRLNKTESKPVQMMYQKKKFLIHYVPEIKTKVLELPYVDKDISMIILLPDDIVDDSTGLKQLEQVLTLEKLQEWTLQEHMRHMDVHVRLPKFKLEDNYELNSPLSSLGMLDLFDGSKADLSGMSGARDLYVSKVVHKSFVEVNEEGTEAAAATAGIIAFCMLMEEEEMFTADHPFLFYIRHNKTNSILFFGRYSSP